MADRPKVPEGFQELLEELSYEVLKNRPSDFIQFSIDFLQSRKGPNGMFITKRTTSGFANDDPLRNDPSLHFNSCPSPNRYPHNNHSSHSVYARRGAVAAESLDPSSDGAYELKIIPKTNEQIRRLRMAARDVLLFRDLEEDDLAALLGSMFEIQINAGDVVIKQGDEGDNFYIIENGKYSASVEKNGTTKQVHEYDGSGSFGELALLYNTLRSASVTAITDGRLWVMNRESFKSVVLKSAYSRRERFTKLLKHTPLLQNLSPYERSQLADALYLQTYEAGEKIIEQGNSAAEMYFVCTGSVKVTKIVDTVENFLCELSEGEYFGELALVNKQPRAATVTAKTAVTVAVLDADSFERLLGPCKGQIEKRIEEYNA